MSAGLCKLGVKGSPTGTGTNRPPTLDAPAGLGADGYTAG
jgi:hypothetical protein